MDEAILRYPILQPAFLFGGADPVDSLRNGFMLADPSPVDNIYAAGPIDIDGSSVTAISLAGHSANQMGILVDGVFFSADVVLPETVLEKYRIPYLYSVTDHLVALERCAEVACDHVVPGHGPLLDNIEDLRAQNLQIVRATLDLVVECCSKPCTCGEVMTYVLDHSGADVKRRDGLLPAATHDLCLSESSDPDWRSRTPRRGKQCDLAEGLGFAEILGYESSDLIAKADTVIGAAVLGIIWLVLARYRFLSGVRCSGNLSR